MEYRTVDSLTLVSTQKDSPMLLITVYQTARQGKTNKERKSNANDSQIYEEKPEFFDLVGFFFLIV